MPDLSHIYANDPDEGQDHFDNLPDELRMHLFNGLAHKAGLAPHPGKYTGPAPVLPDDWETPDSKLESTEQSEKVAIDNLSAGGPPKIPAPAPAKTKPGRSVSDAFKDWDANLGSK